MHKILKQQSSLVYQNYYRTTPLSPFLPSLAISRFISQIQNVSH
jgi:hypothetical protein